MKISDAFLVKKPPFAGRLVNGVRTPADSSAKTLTFLNSLTDGQLVKGMIRGNAPDGKVYLEIAGEKFAARTESNVELENGSQIWLEVKHSGSTLTLSPADRKAVAHNLLRLLFSSSSQIGSTLNSLTSETFALRRFDAVRKSDVILNILTNAIEGQANVKSVVELASFVKALSRESADELQAVVTEAIKNYLGKNSLEAGFSKGMEKFANWLSTLQSLNSQPLSSEQLPLYIFPCFFGMGNGWGEWMISYEDDCAPGGEDEDRYRLDFFLELSKLGDLHLQLTVDGENFFGLITTGNKDVDEHVNNFLPELTGILKTLGFSRIEIGTSLGTGNMLQDFKTVMEQKAQLKSANLVDLKA